MLQGNCTGAPPTLGELGLDASAPLLDLAPGQCVLVTGSKGNYLFSSDVWVDGIYFRQTPGEDTEPVGGAVHVLTKAWITDSTFDWSAPAAGCADCVEWAEGGFHVEGSLYVEGACFVAFVSHSCLVTA